MGCISSASPIKENSTAAEAAFRSPYVGLRKASAGSFRSVVDVSRDCAWARPPSFAHSSPRIAEGSSQAFGLGAGVRARRRRSGSAQAFGLGGGIAERQYIHHSRTVLTHRNLGLLYLLYRARAHHVSQGQRWNAGGRSPKEARRLPAWVLQRAPTHRGSRRNAQPA
jgi:hypothetical protein